MTFSSLISGTIPHHNKYDSRPALVDKIIQHHWAGTTASGRNALASKTTKKSATYLIENDGLIYGQVPEEFRPWTSGSYAADGRAITIEIQNETGAPEWRISDAALSSLVRLLADIASRRGFGKLTSANYKGHREFAQTACPGPYLWGKMQSIRDAVNGGTTPVSNPVPAPIAPVKYEVSQAVKNEQGFLNAARSENLDVDGIMGPNTKAAYKRYQEFLRAYGYTGGIDGIWGPGTQGAHAKYYAEWSAPKSNIISKGVPAPAFPLPAGYYFGPKVGPKESVSGFYSYRNEFKQWQQRMKDRGWAINPDGLYGSESENIARLFQTEKGLGVDGLIGPETWGAAWTADVTR